MNEMSSSDGDPITCEGKGGGARSSARETPSAAEPPIWGSPLGRKGARCARAEEAAPLRSAIAGGCLPLTSANYFHRASSGGRRRLAGTDPAGRRAPQRTLLRRCLRRKTA